MRSLLLLFCLCLGGSAAEPVRVYLVRHAEPVAEAPGQPGPGLSAAGKVRAQALAKLLAGKKVSKIYVSNFARTQETAAPSAAKFKLTPVKEIQDDASLKAVATGIKAMPPGSAVLFVGHSNTVPLLIPLLGAGPKPTIQPDEFNKLFLVSVNGVTATLKTQTYGPPPAH